MIPRGNSFIESAEPASAIETARARPLAAPSLASLRLPRWAVATAIVVLLTLIAYIDFVTPTELSMALFYLLPVAMATWVLGRRSGYVMAFIAAAVWLWVEINDRYSTPKVGFVYFNGLSRLGFFLFSVPVLSSWRMMGERLSRMVDQRTSELRAEVAERKRAERTLRQLARQLSAAEDAERCRVAYDLHDGLSQMLSLMKINLQGAASDQRKARPGESLPLTERLNDSIRMVDSLIDQTRNLTFDLHPAMIDDLGLLATLNGYARDFGKRTRIDVFVTEHGSALTLPSTLAHYLFRAVKELLNNAARHGKAEEIIIAVHWESRRVRIVVDDDGGGFDAERLPSRQGPRGLGLPGITERLRSLGGGLYVESQQGQGTRVILEAPADSGDAEEV